MKRSHVGQWVAFANGELVLVEPDKESLFQKLRELHLNDSVLVKEIVEKERVYQLRSPRVIW